MEDQVKRVGLTAAATTAAKEQSEAVKLFGGVVLQKRAKELEIDKENKGDKQEPKKRKQSQETLIGPQKSKEKCKKKETPTTTPTQHIKKPIPELKGTRQVPKPQDAYGCRHCGIFDLKTLSREDLKYYTKTGAWLENKPCLDCDKKREVSDESVMKIENLLNRRVIDPDEMAKYCNYGAGAHGNDDTSNHHFVCDMVLCIPCHNLRVEATEKQTGQKGRRSARHRNKN